MGEENSLESNLKYYCYYFSIKLKDLRDEGQYNISLINI